MDQSEAATSPSANDLRFYLLGSPQILWNGAPATIDRHKAIALLAYLSLNGRTHHRDKLANLLWPNFSYAQGRSALRRVLASLTSALPGDWWVTDRDNITFCYDTLNPNCIESSDHRDQFWCDVLEFRALRSADANPSHVTKDNCTNNYLERLILAVEVFQGGFMEGFSLKDSSEFDDWQMNQAEVLRGELVDTLEQLVYCLSERKEYETAIRYCKQWVQQDPLEEKAHEYLMHLYVAVRRPNAALQQFQSYRKILETELDILPQETITRLYGSIIGSRGAYEKLPQELRKSNLLGSDSKPIYRSGEIQKTDWNPSQAIQERVPHQYAPRRRYQIIGREQELGLADALWQQVQDGNTVMLLVSGEPGIGKSHLIRAFVDQIAHVDTVILQGECYPNRGQPFTPIAQIIDECFRQPDLEELTSLLPVYVLADLGQIAPTVSTMFPNIPTNTRLDPTSEKQRIFDSFTTFFELLIRSRQTAHLMIFEDMHWSDVDCLQILQYLVRRGRAASLPLMVVLTFRDTEIHLVTSSVLQEMIYDLRSHDLSTHIQLTPLGRQDTGDLVNSLLGGGGDNREVKVAEAQTDAVYSHSGGNPFFIEQLCRFLPEKGKQENNNLLQTWDEEIFISIPVSIRELILSRVRCLSLPCQQVLQQAAFLGRQFDFNTLYDLTGIEEKALISILEEAIRVHLVLETQVNKKIKLFFAHDMIPLALRESLSGLRQQRMHQRVANYLEAHDPGDLSMLSFHYAAAGYHAKAIQYAQEAARQAMRVYAFESALHQLRTALDMLDEFRQPELHLSILEELADVYRLMGNNAEAVTVYQEAQSVWHSLRVKDRWCAVRLNRKIGESITNINQYSDVQRLSAFSRASLESALLLVKGEPAHPETVRLFVALSRNTCYMQSTVDLEIAEQYARESVEMAETLDSPAELSLALASLANVYGIKGYLRERVKVCLQRLALSYEPRFNDLREQTNILLQTGMALYDVGEYNQALVYLSQAENLARQIRDIPVQADALARQGACLFRLDRWDELLAIDSKIRLLEASFTIKRMGVLTCFYYALQANVRFLRDETDLGQVLKSHAFDVMVSVAGPQEKWVRNQHF